MLARLRLGPVVFFVNDVDSADACAYNDRLADGADGQWFLSDREASDVIAFRNNAFDCDPGFELCEILRRTE